MTALTLRSPDEAARRLVAAFLSGRNAATRRAYAADVMDFARHLGVPDANTAAAKLFGGSHGDANGLVLSYRSSMVDKGLAPNTINRRLTAVRSLVKLAQTLGVVAWSIAIGNVKSQAYRDCRGPGREVVGAMLRHLDARTDARAVRDRALLQLMFGRGLRCCECVRLDVGDVNLAAGTINVLGKARTEKEWLTVAAPTVAALRAWLEVRGENPNRAADERDPLFVAMDNRYRGKFHGLSTTGVYDAVRQLGDAVGARVRPHGLRHCSVTTALELGADLRSVSKFARHKSLNLITIYDDAVRDFGGDVARVIAGLSP